MNSQFQVIMFDSDSHASRLMFRDLSSRPNTVETSDIFDIKNPLLKLVNKVHMSGAINRKIALPFRQVWDSFYTAQVAEQHPKQNFIFIFTNVSVKKFRLEYLQKLEKLPNVRLVLIAVDPFLNTFLCPLDIMRQVHFDLIYSFDKSDCEKYGMIYTQSLYSKRTDIVPSKETFDLFFVGRAKDRLQTLQNIALKAAEQGCKCGFFILDVKAEQRKSIPGVTYLDHVLPYDDVLPMILSSNCLLDLVQQGQNGYTMRIYEAIFYNKRLITNNASVRDFRYYTPSGMQIIQDETEIDVSLIKTKSPLDYQYHNDFSPIHLVDEIVQRLS